jgi:class 3 adenylate cyclase/WD40 repeat protein
MLPTWTGIDRDQADQLEAALRLGLATDPSRRPATPGELVERLRAGWAETLPTGVVTFCVSDIDGSAAMWEADPAAMAEALVRHDAVIAACVGARGGQLLKSPGDGDSTVSVFDSATSAVEAAVAATWALEDEPWSDDLRVVVRFALHTGEAERRGSAYYGPSMNLAVRLRSQAEGGQVFLSAVTADLVRDHLSDGYELIDLGMHRLDGLAALELIHALKGPGVRTPAAATECPYRGLLAFQPEDRRYFFGREQVVAELIARLAPGRLLAVVGASGSGKSSILRAGVTAAAQAGELPGIHDARVMTPGNDPRIDPSVEFDLLLVVDQFEELFTLCHDPDRRQAFVDTLLAAPGPVAIGLRADMYGQLAAHPELARAVAGNQLLLGAMSEPELERAVREPARLAGLRIEPGLVELAVHEVAGEPGALPLLSHALRATWGRRDGRTLTVERYRDSGGVSAAIAQTADHVVGSLPAEQRQLARSVFVRLTELGEGMAETRRRVPIDELVPAGVAREAVQGLLERLADTRLVTLGEGTAEVAHEVLIREWPALRGWLDEDREGLRLHRRLGDAARLWEAGGREPSDLYRGSRLSAAAEWAATHRDQLNAAERAFIDAGTTAADRERRSQLRANRRLRGLLAGAGLLLVVAAIAGVLALIQRDRARAQALTSDAERIGAQALTEQHVDRHLLLAVAAVKLQDRAETGSDLLAVLQKNSALIRFSRPFSDLALRVQVSPDGREVALGDVAGRVLLMNAGTWQSAGRAVELGDPLAPRAMSFSPDGRRLMAVTVGSSRASLWAIDTASHRAHLLRRWAGQPPSPPSGSDGVASSPDGRTLAVSLADEPAAAATPTAERLILLDAASGRMLWQRRYPMIPGQAEPHVAFTPDGELLTSAQQGDTLLWNVRSGRVLRRFPVGGLPAISADGRDVALGMNSASQVPEASSAIALLDLRSGRSRTLATNLPTTWIRGIFLTPDGQRIVADAFDGVHVWNVATGTITESYVGQPGQRSVMGMDPAGTTAIVGSQDGSVAAFDVSGTRRLGRAFSWGDPSLSCDGTTGPCDVVNSHSDLLADTRNNGAIALVDLRTLRLERLLPPRDGPAANAVSFLPDGRTMVNGGPNGRVTFWDVSTGRVVRELHLGAPVVWTAPSPDGTLLAVQTQAANSGQSQVDLVRTANGQVLQRHALPNGHQAASGGLIFSPDGREFIALGCCSAGSSVVAWDTRGGRQLYRLSPPRHGHGDRDQPTTARRRHPGRQGPTAAPAHGPGRRAAAPSPGGQHRLRLVLRRRPRVRGRRSRQLGQYLEPARPRADRQPIRPLPRDHPGRDPPARRSAARDPVGKRCAVADGRAEMGAVRLSGRRPRPHSDRVARPAAGPLVPAGMPGLGVSGLGQTSLRVAKALADTTSGVAGDGTTVHDRPRLVRRDVRQRGSDLIVPSRALRG